MNKLLQAVAAKTYQLCRTYPGGIRAMFAGMRERHGLSESSVYADLNPNNGQSTLRVWELVRVMEATGEHGPLRELANWFGYSLASAADEEPDAPTLEAEALQDYPPLVAFHEGCNSTNSKTGRSRKSGKPSAGRSRGTNEPHLFRPRARPLFRAAHFVAGGT